MGPQPGEFRSLPEKEGAGPLATVAGEQRGSVDAVFRRFVDADAQPHRHCQQCLALAARRNQQQRAVTAGVTAPEPAPRIGVKLGDGILMPIEGDPGAQGRNEEVERAAGKTIDRALGARQIVWLDFDLVKTSCGYGVPFFEYQGERDTMDRWAESKGPDGIEAYWKEKNVTSMDGLPTGMPVEA